MLRNILSGIRKKLQNDRVFLELSLIGIALGLAVLVAVMSCQKIVVLNMFYLPVVLGGFFLGRYRAGLLAVLAVAAASVAISQDPRELATSESILVVGLSMLVWAAVLCLTAILVGSLSDEKNAKVRELHEAYVGVVEVLSKYLQSANPKLKDRATRVAELCQKVATELSLSPHLIDDIRVAALMLDLGKIEVTTRLVSRAVDTLESNPEPVEQHSFHGIDLVHSLGAVIKGAIPLLASQADTVFGMTPAGGEVPHLESPIGARIIRAARIYDSLTGGRSKRSEFEPEEALAELERDPLVVKDALLRGALRRAVLGSQPAARQLVLAN
jgi:hypothetical protein